MAAVGLAIFEIHIPDARSLKEKRRVVKSLVDRLHRRYRISIAEVGHHELHQRAQICLAAVCSTEGRANEMLEKLRSLIDDEAQGSLLDWQTEIIGVA